MAKLRIKSGTSVDKSGSPRRFGKGLLYLSILLSIANSVAIYLIVR